MPDVYSRLPNKGTTTFVPEAHVYVQPILDDPASGRQRAASNVVELPSFTSINITRPLRGVASATITLANIDGYYQAVKRTRIYPQSEDEENTEDLDQTLEQLRRLGVSDDVLLNSSEWGVATDKTTPAALYRATFDEDFLLGEWQRIWIDFKGRDGLMYAGFSGIVSAIKEDFPIGGMPTLVLECRDLTRLLGSTLIYELGSALGSLDDTIAEEAGQEASPVSSEFAGISATEVIWRAVDKVQRNYSEDAYFEKTEDHPKIGNATLEEFFHKEKFWSLPGLQANKLPVMDYTGAGLTGTGQVHGGSATLRNVRGKEAGRGIEQGDFVDDLRGELWFDLYIDVNRLHVIPIQLVLSQVISLFTLQKTTADAIANRTADATHFDFFQDANGNLIFQIPKYNNLPATEDDLLDYSPKPEDFPTFGHGPEYNVGLDYLTSMSRSRNEEAIITHVTTPGGFNLIGGFGADIDPLSLTGRTQRADFPELAPLQRRYGVRQTDTSQVVLNSIYSVVGFPPERIKDALSCLAMATLHEINGLARTGGVRLEGYPNLDVGRNLLLPDFGLMGYISNLSISYVEGQKFTVEVQLQKFRGIHERVTNPWVLLQESFRGVSKAAAIATGTK